MAGLAREHMTRHDDARSLMRQLYETSIDLVPDPQSKTLTVRLHHLTARVHDEVIAHLCEELTATETVFPGTNLRLIFSCSAPRNSRGSGCLRLSTSYASGGLCSEILAKVKPATLYPACSSPGGSVAAGNSV